MNQEEIKNILPHRAPMLLLDEVSEQNGEASASYHVRGDEFFLQGHFPEYPVVPGVILCEILAQSACVLFASELGKGKLPMYAGLDKVRFKSAVYPGDTFSTKCRLKRKLGTVYFAEGEGYVGESLCLKAQFSFVIVER